MEHTCTSNRVRPHLLVPVLKVERVGLHAGCMKCISYTHGMGCKMYIPDVLVCRNITDNLTLPHRITKVGGGTEKYEPWVHVRENTVSTFSVQDTTQVHI